MNWNDYMFFTRETAVYQDDWYPVLGLAEEAGEVLGKFAKALRDADGVPDQEVLAKELGDVLWMLTRVGDDHGLDLEYIMELNVRKLKARKADGTIKGSGDHR